MAKITIIHADSGKINCSADLIFTDPPFDLPGKKLATILARHQAENLVLITTMRQLLQLVPHLDRDWQFAFDFVLDAVVPKNSKSTHLPHYTHQTGVYFRKNKSTFNRKMRQRSDTFDNNYWPTVIRAPRQNMQQHGHSKNEQAMADILGSFAVSSVLDPFAGSFTTATAAFQLDLDCTAVELDRARVEDAAQKFKFLGSSVEVIRHDW